ncbi:hypothetical protein JTB14_006483 [Gonioctena quinquepunctata]|nr:hypothetical protein JTB14_006483 [Gonioctena quinquepunctata]
METYQKCLEQLEQHKIEYFTFKTNTEKEIRAIFEGVTEDFSIDDITKDLRSKGFHPRVVARFQNRDKTPMSMILCIVPASDQAITKITSIMDVQVKFEHQRKQARTGQWPLTELELEEIALNLDLDQSDLDDLSSDDDEDEVDLGLKNVVSDPDDIEIADNMRDSSDEEPLAHYLPGYQKK